MPDDSIAGCNDAPVEHLSGPAALLFRAPMGIFRRITMSSSPRANALGQPWAVSWFKEMIAQEKLLDHHVQAPLYVQVVKAHTIFVHNGNRVLRCVVCDGGATFPATIQEGNMLFYKKKTSSFRYCVLKCDGMASLNEFGRTMRNPSLRVQLFAKAIVQQPSAPLAMCLSIFSVATLGVQFAYEKISRIHARGYVEGTPITQQDSVPDSQDSQTIFSARPKVFSPIVVASSQQDAGHASTSHSSMHQLVLDRPDCASDLVLSGSLRLPPSPESVVDLVVPDTAAMDLLELPSSQDQDSTTHMQRKVDKLKEAGCSETVMELCQKIVSASSLLDTSKSRMFDMEIMNTIIEWQTSSCALLDRMCNHFCE